MALGKGLKALIQEEPENLKKADGKVILSLNIEKLMPNSDQPRMYFDDRALEELATSIKEHGILSPLIVKQEKEGYLIIAGERRWRAARRAGLREVPVIVENIPEEKILEIALIENVQREDLNIMEESLAYQNLIDQFHYTQEQLSEKIGKSRASIANVLRLQNLPEEIKRLTRDGRLSYGHARCLLGAEKEEDQLLLADLAKDGGMTVRQLERKVSALKKGEESEPPKEDPNAPYVNDLQERMSDFFESPVKLKHSKNRGKIEIPYKSLEELERILERIGLSASENDGE